MDDEPNSLPDSQMIDEARSLRLAQMEYTAMLREKFRSALPEAPKDGSFWIRTIRIPSSSPENSSVPPEKS